MLNVEMKIETACTMGKKIDKAKRKRKKERVFDIKLLDSNEFFPIAIHLRAVFIFWMNRKTLSQRMRNAFGECY